MQYELRSYVHSEYLGEMNAKLRVLPLEKH